MLTTFTYFIISFLIGLLIGIERERNQTNGIQTCGVRTFILFSMMGTIAATINQIGITLIISLFVFGIILLVYYRSTELRRKNVDIGITTEIAAGIVFCLGYMIPEASLLAITLSAFVLLVLFERQRLHQLARKKFQPHEIETVIILIIFTLGIIPLLPNKTIDPWNLFNPRNFGILMVTIAGIQFAGYIAIRLFGQKLGMVITGFLGGLVSSTAVFANLRQTLSVHPSYKLSIIASSIFAVLAMIIEVMAIVLVASPALLFLIIKPILVMGMMCIFIGMILLSIQKTKTQPYSSSLSNPLNLKSILYTSIFIAFTLILIALAKRFVGNNAIMVISFLGGLFEIHGISLATSLLYLNHNVTGLMASEILYTALFASFVSKFFLLFSLTPLRFALQTSIFLLVILGSGVLTFWLF